MDKREQNLSFGKVVSRTDGSVPDFPEPQVPEQVVEDHYLAFYRVLRPSSEHDGVLASASCVIGSPMNIILDGEDAGADTDAAEGAGAKGAKGPEPKGPHLETIHGEYLAPLTLEDSARLLEARERGWEIRAYVNQVVYSNQDRTLWGEFAFFAYDPSLPALGAFIKALVGRMAHGEHPAVALKQGEFQRVLDSNGAWYLTKETPRPELKAGEAMFKRRRGLADSLVAAANQNKIGCEIAAIIFWLAVIGLIVKLVFF